MKKRDVRTQKPSSIELELYFLIERFLSTGPCKSAAQVLRRELDEHGLLPKRIDWEGKEHERSFESLLELNKHIGGDHLLKICQRLGPLLDEKIRPNIVGVKSLLGAGTQSLLRTQKSLRQATWTQQAHMPLQHGRSVLPPVNLVPPKWQHVKYGQEVSGQTYFRHVIPTCMYDRMQQHSRKLGHLSSVYCLLFDRTGQYIFTAADDGLVKIWWTVDSRLKATLRGHAGEITDMAINYENTLLASGSCDKTIRVWCLKSCAPVAVLQGHSGMITSLQFSPMVQGRRRYLASTGGDACVCFWEWDVRNNRFIGKPEKFVEKSRAGAQVLCSSFSPGGMFFAAGSTDNVIRMYHFQTGYPRKIGELEKHTDRVDSICYANSDYRFLSGSKDGTACIWKFERNEWRSMVLDMSLVPPKREDGEDEVEDKKKFRRRNDNDEDIVPSKLKVTMVGWNIDDTLVVTAINDHSLKVWCSFTGTLLHGLRGHGDEVFVLECSPIDSRIMMSAGHDGNIIIWDIIKGRPVTRFFNRIEGQGHGAVFDSKFSPDGMTIAATDSHGQMMIYGHGSNGRYASLPDQLFFHTDYRPLMRDSNNYVLDEQTQQAPHLMPPPFLVDIDGNPYPPVLQRLVPGREKCRDDQLVPELAVNEDGEQQVLGERALQSSDENASSAQDGGGPEHGTRSDARPVPSTEPGTSSDARPGPSAEQGTSGEYQPTVRASIDEMIEQLAREQDELRAARGEQPLGSPPATRNRSPRSGPSRLNSVPGPSGLHMVGMRRVGETEGVRQSLGNIQQVSTSKDLVALSHRTVIRGMDPAVLRQSESCRIAHAEQEVRQYNLEMRKKRPDEGSDTGIQTRKKKKKRSMHGYSTRAGADSEDVVTNRLTQRALYDTDEEAEELGLESDLWEETELGPDMDDSSDYSDWYMDTSSILQPPKRKSARRRKRKKYDSDESSDDDTEDLSSRGSQGVTPSSREGSQTRGRASQKRGKQPAKKLRRNQAKKLQKVHEAAALPGKTVEEIQELLRIFRPPDWLTDVVPRKQPYFPQMGDEVMYFRQGHEFYVKEVARRKVYPIDPNKNQAWHKYPQLREQELVRIVGIRYEMLKSGVRLCCLKLHQIDPVNLKNSGKSFSIKYHDMPDVVDFLVLKQNYDTAISRNWKPGDRFRSVIDDSWWIGVIEAQIPYQKEYPDSMFQCFKVRWDNSEKENLSPWDMEPFTEAWLRKPRELNGSIKITAEERKSFMYRPKPGEWPGGIEEECDRIVHGWNLVMEHSIAEPFLTPVDVNVFPSYAMSIEYPMDLNTIKRRLENRFYRRVTALQFDLRYIESNAKKFNEPKSQIVKSAQILCDALLNFIGDKNCSDPCPLINNLVRGRKIRVSSDSEDSGEETEDYDTPGTSTDRKTSDAAKAGPSRGQKHQLSPPGLNPDGWKGECEQLLDTIVQCEDSGPFRSPVDVDTYPDYYSVIDHPMDLSIVKENMNQNVYTSPLQFAKDMKLIFSNSKTYNTNKRAKIYSMTLRLSAMFESRMKEILTTYKKAMKHHGRRIPKNRPRYGEAASLASERTPSMKRSEMEPGPSRLTNGKHSSTSEEETEEEKPRRNSFTRTRPVRERRTIQKTSGYSDSDADNHEIPEPKGDYSDEDFEIQPRKSPKKKGGARGARRGVTNGGPVEDSNRYSTRARTGTLKMRKYTNEGFFTDEDEGDSVSPKSKRAHQDRSQFGRRSARGHVLSDASASDTEKESSRSHITRSDRGRGRNKVESLDEEEDSESESETEPESPKLSRKRGRGRQPKTRRRGRPPAKKRRTVEYNESEEEEDTASTTSEDSGTEGFESAEDHHSPVTRSRASQGTRFAHLSGSDSSPPGKSLRQESSRTGQGRRTRNQGKSTVKYAEDSGNSDSDDTASVTVSMRGRVRRPTARARAMWD